MKKTIKNAMSSLTAKLAALLFAFTCAGTAWGATEVGTYDELVSALAAGGEIKLTANIVAPDKATLTLIDGTVLDLGGQTLTVNGESGTITGSTIKNGTIAITTYTGDTVADGLFDTYGECSMQDVNFTSTKCAIYAIFDIKSGNLSMTRCNITISDNNKAGGLIYFNSSDPSSKLTMTDCTVDCTDIGDFLCNGIAELNDCTIDIDSKVAGGLDNVINGTALTINNTKITVDGAAGRGITTDGDDIIIKGNSVVTLTNCEEGGIRYKASATISVAETATLTATSVTVDSVATAAKINGESLSVTGSDLPSVTVKNGSVSVVPANAVAKIGDTWYETLAAAVTAANSMTGEVTIEIYGKSNYDSTVPDIGSTPSKVNFVGKTADAEICSTRIGGGAYITSNADSVTFTDLILSRNPTQYYANAGQMGYYFTVRSKNAVSYSSCTFPNGACAEGNQGTAGTTTYTSCTFNATDKTASTKELRYTLWVYADVTCTVDGCTFGESDRAIKMYKESGAESPSLVLKNSDFSAVSGSKPAIVLSYAKSVTLEGNTYPEEGVFELDKDKSPDGTIVVADIQDIACNNDDYTDCGVLVDGKIYTTVTAAQNADAIKSDSSVTLFYSPMEASEDVELPEGVTVTSNGYALKAVAKVGNTKYGTIDEAVAAWTGSNNSTMTLLADVTLSDTVHLTTSSHHTLNLSTFTLTGPSNKDVIQIDVGTLSSATYVLDVEADATTPGKIVAVGSLKAAIRYNKTNSAISDRPIITIKGGVFEGFYGINLNAKNGGAKSPYVHIRGGTFNNSLYGLSLDRATTYIYDGAVFNCGIYASVDSTARMFIQGGKFKSVPSSAAADLPKKWTYGTAIGTYDRDIYVDSDGYYVVSSPITAVADKPSVYGASLKNTGAGTLACSNVKTEGRLYYATTERAMAALSAGGDIELYTDCAEGKTLSSGTTTITVKNGATYSGTITLSGKNAKVVVVPLDGTDSSVVNGSVSGYVVCLEKTDRETYSLISESQAAAKIGDYYYKTLDAAVANYQDGNTIYVLNYQEDVTVAPEGWTFKAAGDDMTLVKAVAKIGTKGYLTVADALAAVQDGETITVLDATGNESGTELTFDRQGDIAFTITGTAPNYRLPIITFADKDGSGGKITVTIKDATLSMDEIDARQNATVNVVDSFIDGKGGNTIVKSYFNGAINISGTSKVYTMQVTTMGYITISDSATLTATWQANVYGNGLISVNPGATFNTAALNLTGQAYSGRDNTDADRVGKPAAVIVDGATLNVGVNAYSSSGADYNYNSTAWGINVGTVDGKSAILDIKNDSTVVLAQGSGSGKFGGKVSFGAGATVNVTDGSSLTVQDRGTAGVTLTNQGTVALDAGSSVTAPEFVSEDGKVTVDMANFDGTLPLTVVTTTGGEAVLGDFEVYNMSDTKIVVDTNGDLSVVAKVYVAQLGNDGQKFETLAEAVAAAQDGETVTVLANTTLDEQAVVSGKAITLDLAGKTVTATVDDAILVEDDAELTVKGEGTVIAGVATAFVNEGTLVIESGTVKGSAGNGAILVANDGGTLDVNGGTFELKVASGTGGWAIANVGGVATITDATIVSEATSQAVGVWTGHPDSVTTIDGNTQISVKGADSVAVFTWTDGETTILDGVVSAEGDEAAAIQNDSTGTTTVSGGTITAGESCAAVLNTGSGSVEISGDAEVAATGSNSYAAYALSSGEIDITGGTITGTVDENLNDTVMISGGSFSNPVREDFCADGFEPVAEPNANDMYTVQVEEGKVARNIEQNKAYASLADAFAEAAAGETVQLLADIDLGSGYVAIDKALTLDGDFTVKSSAAQTVLLTGSGDVTIKCDITATAGHGIQAGTDSAAYSGKLTVDGSTVTVAKRGIRVYKEDTGFGIVVNDSTIQSNVADPTTTYTTGNDAMALSLGTTDGKGYSVELNNTVLQGFSYCINSVTSGSNLTVVMNGGKTYGRAALNVWGSNNTFTLDGVEVHGLNNQTGPTEAFACIVENKGATNNTYNINGCTFNAELSSAAASASGSSATEQMIDLRGTKATVKITGATTYAAKVGGETVAPTDAGYDRFGLIASPASVATYTENSIDLDQTAATSLAGVLNALPEDVDQEESEVFTNGTSLGYTPEVLYYWATQSGYQGGYYSFNEPFDEGWLADGEFIALQKDVTLSKNLSTDKSFNLLLDSNTLTSGDYKITLAAGVTVTSDTANLETLFAIPDGCCLVSDTDGTSYTYTVAAAVAQIGTTKYASLADAVAAAQAGDTITLLADCETGSQYTLTNPLVLSADNVTLDLNGKTITATSNFSFLISGDNDVVKNGTIQAGANTGKQTGINSYAIVVNGCDGVKLTGLTVNGGISIGGSTGETPNAAAATNVVIEDCTVTSGDYYAVCAQQNSTVTIASGSYTANTACSSSGTIYASFAGTDGPKGTVYVTGGKFSGKIPTSNKAGDIVISGGVFSVAPDAKFCAAGYVVTDNTDAETSTTYPWTVMEILTGDIIYPIEGTDGVPVALAWATNNTSAVSEGAPVTAANVPNIITALGENGANNMPRWQSYVLGLNPADATAVLRLGATAKDATTVTITGSVDTTKFPSISNVTVTFRLAAQNGAEWTDIATGAETPSFDVSLDDVAGKVLTIFADIVTK